MSDFEKIFKKPNIGWIVWMGIFLSYIIVGVGVYLWQNSLVKETRDEQTAVLRATALQEEKMAQEAALLQKTTAEQLEKIKNNEIDLATVKIGDRLANGMKLGNIIGKGEAETFLEFTGSIVVSGNFKYFDPKRPGGPETGFYNVVCLEPDKESATKIPKVSLGVTKKMVCFTNTDVAKSRFGPPGNSGRATVAIDKFRLLTGNILYDFDEAELIRTIEITK